MKWLIRILLLLLALAAILGFKAYDRILAPNVNAPLPSDYLYIPTGTDLDGLSSILTGEGWIKNGDSFVWLAGKMNYGDRTIKPGKYSLNEGNNNLDLIRQLRSGNQVPVKVVFNNIRTLDRLAGKVSEYIETDSFALLDAFMDPNVQSSYELNEETMMTLFIPNTYEFFWNTSEKGFLERMKKERDAFWNQERLQKAQDRQMTPEEVYTLASIVEKETNVKSERPTMAGVYLNRLEQGIPLQADPTVVFAVGDFTIKRVLNRHLEIDSPYNTYKNTGLPPGPISMASISSIDAVLNAESHDYIFFCAKPGNSGQHAFAKTLAQHNRNARKYQRWLNSQGILK